MTVLTATTKLQCEEKNYHKKLSELMDTNTLGKPKKKVKKKREIYQVMFE